MDSSDGASPCTPKPGNFNLPKATAFKINGSIFVFHSGCLEIYNRYGDSQGDNIYCLFKRFFLTDLTSTFSKHHILGRLLRYVVAP